jgi:hypothetical protein
MKTQFFLFLSIFFFHLTKAQEKLPCIHASSLNVAIKSDDFLNENAWTIVPEAKPDEFKTSAKKVTFYTNLDSISFDIKRNGVYDFNIIVNNKDTAWTRITWEPSKLEILKKAEQFNFNDKQTQVNFTYQKQNHPDLIKLKTVLNLDSIAGSGTELSKIFNLMHFVHNTIEHDGGSNNPSKKNALDLIKVCKTKNRGVNCRMMATVLNDCYLAMGIKSRHITCMPRPTKVDECHVINMVYSSDLKKWIWIDPTFAAYVMDEKGNLLGIGEVRERLIKDLPLILNPDANWNRNVLQTKEHYLDEYMAKNLYRLETPVHSQYNMETFKPGKTIEYIELLPLDGIKQNPKKERWTGKNGVHYIKYRTNNPDVFWEKL